MVNVRSPYSPTPDERGQKKSFDRVSEGKPSGAKLLPSYSWTSVNAQKDGSMMGGSIRRDVGFREETQRVAIVKEKAGVFRHDCGVDHMDRIERAIGNTQDEPGEKDGTFLPLPRGDDRLGRD